MSKPETVDKLIDAQGNFIRKESVYRDFISEDHPYFQPEADRYHLYISFACPWANRTLVVRKLKGLEHVIGLSIVHCVFQKTKPEDPNDEHIGWVFRSPEDPPVVPHTGFGSISCEGCIPDTINGAKTIRELYEKAGAKQTRFTVPVLWDKKLNTIVNNESSEIIRMFNTAFNKFSTNPDLDIYPPQLKEAIDAVNEWVYPNINNGVYRCGFAKSQQAYDTAIIDVFTHLDKMEQILSTQRYLVGSKFTEADVRAFMTLIRFDEVYVVYFKTNVKMIKDYPNILNYCREIYQMPGIADCINMNHIKAHYYCSHPALNSYSIIPKGPNTLEELSKPHDRDTKVIQ